MTGYVKSDIVNIFMERKTYYKSLLLFLIISIGLILFNPILQNGTWELYAQETPSVSLLEKGKKLLEENKADDALKVFEEALSQNPNDPLLYYYSGVAYHLKRQPQQALAMLSKALELFPGMPQAILKIGIIFEEVRRFDKAIESYRTVIESKADAAIIKEAEERLRKLNITVHFRNAGKLFQEKKFEDSLAELQIVLSLSPEHVDAHFASGMAFQRLGKLKEAIDEFKKVAELNPAHPDALYQAALTYEAQSAYEEAIEAFKKIISIAPESKNAKEAEKRIEENVRRLNTRKHFEATAEFMRKEMWPEALKEGREVLAVEPKNPNALFNLGLILYQIKDNTPAIDALKQAIEIDPKFQKAILQLGVIYDDQGNYREAAGYYKQVLEINEKTSEGEKAKERIEVLRYITESEEKATATMDLLKNKDVEGAIKETEALLLVRKDDPKLFYTLAVLYMTASRLKDAVATLEKAIALDPGNKEMRFLVAQLYESIKEYQKAADAYHVVVTLEGESPRGKEAAVKAITMVTRSHFEKGKRFMTGGSYEAALQEMQSILEISPDEPIALFNIGILYDRLNRPEDAVDSLKRAVLISPDYIQAYTQLGLVFEKLRKFPEAREAYGKVISLQTKGRESQIARAKIELLNEYETLSAHLDKGIKLMDEKDWAGARKEFNTGIALNPKNYLGYYYLGAVLIREGIYDEAKAAYKKVIEINPKYFSAYLSLAALLVKLEEYGEARDLYLKVVKLGEQTPEADMASEMLKQLKPWMFSFSMSQSYNTNIAFRSNAQSDFSSNYSLGLNYIILRQKGWNLATSLSGSESIYFKTQLKGEGYNLSLSGSRQFSEESSISSSISYSKSLFMGKPTFVNTIINCVAKIEPRAIPTSASISYSGSRGISFMNKASNAEKHSLSLSVSQKLSVKDSVSGSYSFSIHKNLDLLGSNYANRSHSISVNYGRPIFSILGINMGYNYSLINYSNPDSTTFFQQLRTNTNQSLSSSLSLDLSKDVSISLSYNFAYAISRTNLPTPTAEERQKLQDILASPIPTVGGDGGYYSHAIGLHFSTIF